MYHGQWLLIVPYLARSLVNSAWATNRSLGVESCASCSNVYGGGPGGRDILATGWCRGCRFRGRVMERSFVSPRRLSGASIGCYLAGVRMLCVSCGREAVPLARRQRAMDRDVGAKTAASVRIV